MDGRQLHDAAMSGNTEIVALLIKAGANVNAQDIEDRWTPLHDATRMNHPKVAQLLLSAGADPFAPDKWQQTPIHYAKEYKFNEILKLFRQKKKNK